MSAANKVFRLRSSVALVRSGKILEFFDSNERIAIRIEIEYNLIVPLLQEFDGQKTVVEVSNKYPGLDLSELEDIIIFLNKNYLLVEVDLTYSESEYGSRPRLYNHLEGFFCKTSEVMTSVSKLDAKKILVIGLGGVGSWVVQSLAAVGAKHVYLMDDDVVEISNIHRQDFYGESDIGRYKVDSISEKIKKRYGYEYNSIKAKLVNIESFQSFDYDLIINCADWPSVDETSRLVSTYCMPRDIPHVIGGGYNLHLTLVGQAVIPGMSACFMCFEKFFAKENSRELFGVKKLYRESRKIGSFGAVCAVSASITALESMKLLLGIPIDRISILNKRLEFNLATMDFSSVDVPLSSRCGKCGWG